MTRSTPHSTDSLSPDGATRPPGPQTESTGIDFLAPPQAPDEIGRLGPYRVLKELGRGGMGVVFQAEDPGLRRLCALKTMLPEVAKNAEMKERFLREARAAAQLEHDNVIAIHQVGEDHGVPYIAMPFLKGCSLDELIRDHRVLAPGVIVRIGREISRGLAAAHAKGMIHRDIKPANVWLDESADGRVKILDFGLARQETTADQKLTKTGALMGTPSYISPEQLNGQAYDARCDLFSLGVVLYRMAAGELPFRGQEILDTLKAIVKQNPPPPTKNNPTLPAALSDLIMRLLVKDPAQRTQLALDVVRELDSLGIPDAPLPQRPLPTAADVPDSETVLRGQSHATQTAAVPTCPSGTVASSTSSRLTGSFGKYEIRKFLGEGGMAEVYVAFDSRANREIALKIPKFPAVNRQPTIQRFYREARIAAGISHPHLCPIFEVDEIDGVPYLTMPLLGGESLDKTIKSMKKPPPERATVQLVQRVAMAMEEAHKQQIVHRDLKPGNVMIDQRKQPIVMDFGLARITKSVEAGVSTPGMIVGTLAYMPPEQIRGDDSQIGPATDVYALGVMLYELLTLRLPFEGAMLTVMTQIATKSAPPPSTYRPGLDPALEAICLKAIAKKTERRYASMAEFAAALGGYLKTSGEAAPVTNHSQSPARQAGAAATSPAIAATPPPGGVVISKSALVAAAVVAGLIVVALVANAFRMGRTPNTLAGGGNSATGAALTPVVPAAVIPATRSAPPEAVKGVRFALDEPPTTVVTRPGNLPLLTISAQGDSILWDWQTGEPRLNGTSMPLTVAPDCDPLVIPWKTGSLVINGGRPPETSGRAMSSRQRQIPRGYGLSVDDNWLFLANRSGTRIDLWDLTQGRRTKSLPGPGKPVCAISVSRDGTMLFCGTTEGVIVVRDLASGLNVRTINGGKASRPAPGRVGAAFAPRPAVSPVGLPGGSPSGMGEDSDFGNAFGAGGVESESTVVLFAAAADRAVILEPRGLPTVWDVSTGQQLRELPDILGARESVALSPNGACVLVPGVTDTNDVRAAGAIGGGGSAVMHDQTLKLIDVETGTAILTIAAFSKQVRIESVGGASFSDNRLIARFRTNHQFIASSPDSATSLQLWQLPDLPALADGTTLAATLGGLKSDAPKWQPRTIVGEIPLFTDEGPVVPEAGTIYAGAMLPDSSRALVVLRPANSPTDVPVAPGDTALLTLALVDVSRGVVENTWATDLSSGPGSCRICSSPGGKSFAILNGAGDRLLLWEADGSAPRTLTLARDSSGAVPVIAFSGDGGRLLVMQGPRLTTVDLATAKSDTKVLPDDAAAPLAAIAADESMLCVARSDGQFVELAAQGLAPRRVFAAAAGELVSVAFSLDAKWAVATSQARDSRPGQGAMPGIAGMPTSMEGDNPIVPLTDGSAPAPFAAVLHVASGEEAGMARSNEGGVTFAAFDPAATHLFTGHASGRIIQWELSSGRIVAQSEPADVPDQTRAGGLSRLSNQSTSDAVTTLSVCTDGSRLLAMYQSGAARLWSLSRLRTEGNSSESVPQLTARATFSGHTAPVASVTVSGDGTNLVSATRNGQLFTWTPDGSVNGRELGKPEPPPVSAAPVMLPNGQALFYAIGPVPVYVPLASGTRTHWEDRPRPPQGKPAGRRSPKKPGPEPDSMGAPGMLGMPGMPGAESEYLGIVQADPHVLTAIVPLDTSDIVVGRHSGRIERIRRRERQIEFIGHLDGAVIRMQAASDRLLATNGVEIRFWELAAVTESKVRPVATRGTGIPPVASVQLPFDARSGGGCLIDFSGDGSRAIVGSASALDLVVIDTQSGRILHRLRPSSGPAHRVAISPTGRFVVMVPAKSGIQTGAKAGGKTPGGYSVVQSVVQTPEAEAQIWDLEKGLRPIAICPGHPGGTHALAFLPDETGLITGGEDRQVRVWPLGGK